MLKDVLGKSGKPGSKRHAAIALEQMHGISERRACQVLSLHRSTKHRQPGYQEQNALVARIHALSERDPRFGYHKTYILLKVEQRPVSRETVRCIGNVRGYKW